MSTQYDIVIQLTSQAPPREELSRVLNDFASMLGWRPSDKLQIQNISEIANAHLVVEHGLENTAVITFLRGSHRFNDLNYELKNRLLGISYNNLVDWHIYVESEKVTFVYNRKDPVHIVEQLAISRENVDVLRSAAFEEIIGKRPNPNLRALDDALISTISYWKRSISAEMQMKVSNEAFSALFNSIIFVRAVEDHFKRISEGERNSDLQEKWNSLNGLVSLRELFRSRLESDFQIRSVPSYILDWDQLDIFDHLDVNTVGSFLRDFYRIKYTPYDYDFSVMSKHALSRIYEHYVSILRAEDSSQLAFFPSLPREQRDKMFGSVYTPQFIARFFARYLEDNVPPAIFKRIKTADPACGSGIFLRTLLEMQCDLTRNGITSEQIKTSFSNVLGIDLDPNACQATRLSLALLHFVVTDQLPPAVNIISAEAIQYYLSNQNLKGTFDAIIANPPFVSLGTQAEDMRKQLSGFLRELSFGRNDLYLAFLLIGLDMLKPGGFGMFVLPHSFLLSKSASKLRSLIFKESWIRCLADLSAIRVFEDSSSYVILLIFQKKNPAIAQEPEATIIKCQELVGKALQDALEGKQTETNVYSIYNVNQERFGKDGGWSILPPTEAKIESRLDKLPRLHEFLESRAGFISGADEIFVIPNERVPKGEESLFVRFLADRQMQLYSVPKITDKFFFYPFVDDEKITETKLKRDFKKTWAYLVAQKSALETRLPVVRGQIRWWEPTRPRLPEHMMRPKIVSPHLVLVPKFSVDMKGKYAISRAPLLYPKEISNDKDILRFFVAVLNSSVAHWFISSHSHKYSKGYSMLEPGTLKQVPVPDPMRVPHQKMKRLLELVDMRIRDDGPNSRDLEQKIDDLITQEYKLSSEEKKAIGFSG